MSEVQSKYVSIPICTRRWQRSSLTGGMIPIFDQFTMLRSDYDRILAVGGEDALRQWIDFVRDRDETMEAQ